jgi:hypothetical protein
MAKMSKAAIKQMRRAKVRISVPAVLTGIHLTDESA